MSSISSNLPNVPTQPQTSPTVQSTSTTTSTSTTIPDFGLFGRAGLTRDSSGLTAPKTPDASSTLIDEILSLAETLAALSREERIRASANALRAAFGPLVDLFSVLNGQSETTFNWQVKIDDLTKERGEQSSVYTAKNTLYEQKKTSADTLSGTLSGQWGYYNSWAEYYDGLIRGYDQELANSKLDPGRRAQLSGPNGLRAQADNNKNYNVWYRDVYTYSYRNPTYNDWQTAMSDRDQALKERDAAGTRIKQIDETDMPNATNGKTGSQLSYEAVVAFTTLLTTALSLQAGANNAKATGSDPALDKLIEEAFAALLDKISDLKKQVAGITLDWSNSTTTPGTGGVGESGGDNGAKPMPRVAAVLLAFLTSLAEVGRALAELAELKNEQAPGLPFSNERYRVAV